MKTFFGANHREMGKMYHNLIDIKNKLTMDKKDDETFEMAIHCMRYIYDHMLFDNRIGGETK